MCSRRPRDAKAVVGTAVVGVNDYRDDSSLNWEQIMGAYAYGVSEYSTCTDILFPDIQIHNLPSAHSMKTINIRDDSRDTYFELSEKPSDKPDPKANPTVNFAMVWYFILGVVVFGLCLNNLFAGGILAGITQKKNCHGQAYLELAQQLWCGHTYSGPGRPPVNFMGRTWI